MENEIHPTDAETAAKAREIVDGDDTEDLGDDQIYLNKGETVESIDGHPYIVYADGRPPRELVQDKTGDYTRARFLEEEEEQEPEEE